MASGNIYDERYDFRLAEVADIEKIMNFIGTYWKKGHILSRDRAYFEYEFREGSHVNFVLAVDRETQEIEALWGFLKASSDPDKMDIWGSIWKVNEEHKNMGNLGIELIKRTKPLIGYRNKIGIGANPRTSVPVMKLFFKEKGCKMEQYYCLNPEMKPEDFQIALIQEKPAQVPLKTGKMHLISSFEELKACFSIESCDRIPYKDSAYVNKKFFENPRRKYLIYGIESENSRKLDAFFVAREAFAEGRKALRILDYYGNHKALATVGENLRQLMCQEGYEYIDFYHLGFDRQSLADGGFTLRKDRDVNIIPNYFEPFTRENIDIWVHYLDDATTFFKADGDQDRANA